MTPTRAIEGFLAWSSEFVGEVKDHSRNLLSAEWEEQLELLYRAKDSSISVPDICSDEIAVEVIDELKYRLRREQGPIGTALVAALNDVGYSMGLCGRPPGFSPPPSPLLPFVANSALLEKEVLSPMLSSLLHARIKKARAAGHTDVKICAGLGLIREGESYTEALRRESLPSIFDPQTTAERDDWAERDRAERQETISLTRLTEDPEYADAVVKWFGELDTQGEDP